MNRQIKKILAVIIAVSISIPAVLFAASITSYSYDETRPVVTFGSYPQTKIEDENLISQLNMLVSEDDFIDLNYFYGDYNTKDKTGSFYSAHPESYEFYADVIYNGEKYRALKFTEYRPLNTYEMPIPNDNNNYVNRGGYYKNMIHWFKFDPVEWIILDEDTGLAITKNCIEAQPYNNTRIPDKNFTYENSSIRSYLNNEFLNWAFTESDHAEIITDGDAIRLLTASEVVNEEYGFNSNSGNNDQARMALATNYAIANGCYNFVASSTSEYWGTNWFLQDEYSGNTLMAQICSNGRYGTAYKDAVRGIRPVANFKLENVNKYSINYIVNGKIAKTDYYNEGDTVISYIPSIEGNEFEGWDTAIPETMPAKNIYTGALTSLSSYQLNIDYAGGYDEENKTQLSENIPYGSEITMPSVSKDGYSFEGWSSEIPDTMPAHNINVSALWKANRHYIDWITDGNVNRVEYEFDSLITPPEIPDKEGYVSNGWDAEIPGKMPDKNLTFTAQYSVNSYKINWIANGNTTTQSYDYGSAINPPASPQAAGYTFIKWSPNIPETMPAKDLTFTAEFKKSSYTVTWIADGKITKENYEVGSAIKSPASPGKSGYEFIKWSPDIPAEMPESDLTFNAEFKPVTYYVTFIADGKQVGEKIPFTVETDSISAPAVPVKEGYTGKWSPYNLAASDITVTAVYQKNPEPQKPSDTEFRLPAFKEQSADYKTIVSVSLKINNVPDGAEVYIAGKPAKKDGSTYTAYIGQITETKTVNVEIRQNGKTVDSSTVKINVDTGFFSKLISVIVNFIFNLFKWKNITLNF